MSHAIYLSALNHHQNAELILAENLYQQVLASNPKHADALHYLGVIYYQTNRNDLALASLMHAIQLNPQVTDYYNHYGLALKQNNQLSAAIKSFETGLRLNPKDLSLQQNIAATFFEAERFEEAAGYYRRLSRLRHNKSNEFNTLMAETLALTLLNLGNQCAAKGAYLQAEACFQEALLANPNEITCYYNLGNAQRELGLAKEAEISYLSYLKHQPSDADAHNNCGNVQREQGKLAQAIASYQTALQHNPALYHAKVHLVHQKQHACDWHNLDHEITEIRNWVKTKPTAQISPFAFLSMPNTTEAEQLQCVNNWLENRYASTLKQANTLDFTYPNTHLRSNKKIKIGYLSADFRLHPLAFLITELIELHDSKQFEVHGYSYGINDKSSERKRLEKAFFRFNDIRALSITDAAKKINADQIDILIDLTGFTQSSRTHIVALKPAPVSINWLGFPGSMGALAGQSLFDYMISDNTITPLESECFYAEKLIRLNCYQPIDTKRAQAKPPKRADYQLPENAFVFCSFNQSFKISADIFAIWLRLLLQVDNSVLWLLDCNSIAKQNLIKTAIHHGVSNRKLIFAPRETFMKHLARHALADLMLDTLPYNAHTTASDAIFAGLPLLTCQGTTFAGRVASSLLLNNGLPELVTTHLADYEAKALYWAQNPAELTALKLKLTQHKANMPISNTKAFTTELETNLHTIWQAHIAKHSL